MSECRKYLRCEHGGHNKHYFIAVHATSFGSYTVKTAWGRIGNDPQGEKDVDTYPTLSGALAMVDRIVDEKVNKGYFIAWENMSSAPRSSHNVWLDVKRKQWKTANIGEPLWFDEPPKTQLQPKAARVVAQKSTKQEIKERMFPPDGKRSKKAPEKKRMFRKNADWNF